MFHFHGVFAHSLIWPELHQLRFKGWLILLGALVAGGLVKGVVSIGVPLVAIPLLTGILSLKQAVLLLSLPIFIGNIPQALEGGKTLETAKSIGFLIAGAMLGIALGVKILLAIPGHIAIGVAGVVLIVATLWLLAAPKYTLSARWSRPVGLVVGFVGGLMEGVSAIPGPLLATYLLATGSTGKRFTKQIALVLLFSIVALIAAFSQSHHANLVDLGISALASIPVIGGILLGRPLRDALAPKMFRVLVLVFILFAAVQMVWKSGMV